MALLVAGLSGVVAGPASSQEGLSLPGLSGDRLSERDLQGDVIIVFFASWSPRCRDIVPRINQIERNWESKARVLAVDFQESAEEVRSFLQGQDVKFEVYLDQDGGFSKKNSITYLPSLLVLDDGTTAFRGKLPASPDSLLRQIFG
jgi:thiol-disulfide isomerase/thioredoxin